MGRVVGFVAFVVIAGVAWALFVFRLNGNLFPALTDDLPLVTSADSEPPGVASTDSVPLTGEEAAVIECVDESRSDRPELLVVLFADASDDDRLEVRAHLEADPSLGPIVELDGTATAELYVTESVESMPGFDDAVADQFPTSLRASAASDDALDQAIEEVTELPAVFQAWDVRRLELGDCLAGVEEASQAGPAVTVAGCEPAGGGDRLVVWVEAGATDDQVAAIDAVLHAAPPVGTFTYLDAGQDAPPWPTAFTAALVDAAPEASVADLLVALEASPGVASVERTTAEAACPGS